MSFNVGHIGLANPDQTMRASERCCRECRGWFPAEQFTSECPGCGKSRGPAGGNYRRWILDNHLYKTAANAR